MFDPGFFDPSFFESSEAPEPAHPRGGMVTMGGRPVVGFRRRRSGRRR